MKKFDLYEIAIKLLGLYLVIVIVEQLRSLLTFIPIMVQPNNSAADLNRTYIFLVMSFGLIVLILFTWFLIFRTKQITRLITKPTDKEEDIKLFTERKTIYEICLVLLGLIMIVWALPDFIFKLKNYLTFVQNNQPFKNYDKAFLISSGIEIIVGALAIAYSVQIADLLTKKRNIDRENQS